MKSANGVKLELKQLPSPIPFKGLGFRDTLDVPNHQALSRSLEFMERNYTRPIQVADVVIASEMSRRGFLKAFRKFFGRAPGLFIRQARIELAKRLLTEHDLPLKTIASITGFRSHNSFYVAFHRETGVTPKTFQRHAWLSVYRSASFRKNSQFQEVIQ
ncbi:MAG TPA: AraC family transcriptional regulator [Verrucomicrobiae bacterium]|jgi:transcriptional regulator GlxA family with amidase domain